MVGYEIGVFVCLGIEMLCSLMSLILYDLDVVYFYKNPSGIDQVCACLSHV